MSHQLLDAGEARAVVLARSRGRCECCGQPLGNGWEAHHRKLRSQGGTWCPCNVLALRARCHNQGPRQQSVHEQPTLSTSLGLIVPSWADPRDRPIMLRESVREGLVWLGCGGTYLRERPLPGGAS